MGGPPFFESRRAALFLLSGYVRYIVCPAHAENDFRLPWIARRRAPSISHRSSCRADAGESASSAAGSVAAVSGAAGNGWREWNSLGRRAWDGCVVIGKRAG